VRRLAVVACAALACARTDLGATQQRIDAGIDARLPSTDFKVWYPDAHVAFTTHVWHSRDASIDDFPFDRVGAFTHDGYYMGVTRGAKAFMLDSSGDVAWSQSVQGLDVYDAQPRSDGKRLLVTSEAYGAPPTPSIGTLDSDGTYHPLATNIVDRPAYGSDGTTIVFVELLHDGTYELETMHDDGSQRTVWMTTATPVQLPSFSWDQQRIVFATPASIVVLDCASSATTTLIESDAATMYGFPSFTPDGSAIIYVEEAYEGAEDSIVRLDIATRARTTLLEGGTSEFSAGISIAED